MRRDATMSEEAAPSAPPRRSGRQAGYPGKGALGVADERLRAALSRLARDPDPGARLEGARLAEEATERLHALAARAEEASTAAKRARAKVERLSRQLDHQLDQAERRQRGGSP
jgi:hypothetical protein